MRCIASIPTDHNYAAKITFGSNITQFNNGDLCSMIKHNWVYHTHQNTENRFAINANLYIALVNKDALKPPYQLNNIRLSI
jgi:hypothetical protein